MSEFQADRQSEAPTPADKPHLGEKVIVALCSVGILAGMAVWLYFLAHAALRIFFWFLT